MVPIEQKDWTEEDRASKLGQNHPLDSREKRLLKLDAPHSALIPDRQYAHATVIVRN